LPDGGTGEEVLGVSSGLWPLAVASSDVPPAPEADEFVEVPLDVPDEVPGADELGVAPALPASVPETPEGL